MGVKNAKAHKYLKDNRRFADVFNYHIFEGKQVIRPENLQEKDSTELISVYGIGREETEKQKWRDLLNSAIIKADSSNVYVLLGVENQSEVHYAMPVRDMLYDALNYSNQVQQAAQSHAKDKDYEDNAEFLSGFKASDKLTPVITLVIYWGAKPWNAPRSLFEMFSCKNEKILQFVSDYKLNLIVPCEIQDFEKFQSSLGEVLEVISASGEREKMNQILKTNPAFQNLENEAVSMINTFTESNIPLNEKEETTNMCKAWQDQWQDGVETGIEQGIEQGVEQGIQESIRRLLNKGCTCEEVANLLDVALEKVKSVKAAK